MNHNIGGMPPLNREDGHAETRAAIEAYRDGERASPVAFPPDGLDFCDGCDGAGVVLTIPESDHDGVCRECEGTRFASK